MRLLYLVFKRNCQYKTMPIYKDMMVYFFSYFSRPILHTSPFSGFYGEVWLQRDCCTQTHPFYIPLIIFEYFYYAKFAIYVL